MRRLLQPIIDWWDWLIIYYIGWDMLVWRYCQVFGHIKSPPYNWRYEGSWPRCRRCKLTCIVDEDLPADFWTNPVYHSDKTYDR